MAYSDVNTPVIEKIILPSGNTYFIADREIRDVVDTLSKAIAGGVTFIVTWDGSAAPVVANVPAGVKIIYNNVEYTGTLAANDARPGVFYLVRSQTQAGSMLDAYDEYVPVGETGSKTWEKIGDTQLNLNDVVTNVTFDKVVDSVIGSDSTFTITQPTIELGGNAETAAGRVQVATGNGTSSSTNTDWLKSVSVSNKVLTIGAATIDTTYLGATASGANTAWNNKDSVSVLTDSTDITVTKGT